MNVNELIPLISALVYLGLIVYVFNSALNREKRVFLWYLATAMAWSLSSYVIHANFFPTQTMLINQCLVFAGFLMSVALFHFVTVFTRRFKASLFFLSIIFTFIIAILSFGGFIVESSVVVNHVLFYETSVFFLAVVGLGLVLWILSVHYLVWRYRQVAEAIERNRILYLLVGIGCIVFFSISLAFEVTSRYPVDHVGNLLNAIIIAYAIMRYQMLNIKFVVRRSLAYALLTVPLALFYIAVVIGAGRFFPNLSTYLVVLIASGLAVAMVILFRALRLGTQEMIDRIFYRDTYKHRQTLLNLAHKLGGVINLNQLADEILPSLCKALHVSRAELMLRDISTGNYATQFAYPTNSGDSGSGEIYFNANNPVVSWLEKRNRPLEVRQMGNIPEFKGLWQAEKEQLVKSGLGMLSPIKSQGKLIGIFALGKKPQSGIYSQEDLETMMTIASQSGIIVENAHYYSQALLKANTDGLTGLYNHRHFHERLEQEIARSSRFGTVFSIILLDIDLFKVYNDNFGHLAGDEVLRRIGEYIRSSIRSIDIGARYGGEEFSVILPETRLGDAYVVAERIRKTIETKTSSRPMPVTVSIGVASWPVDGVMKEELLNRADRALYSAKEEGRNRTVLTTEIEPAGTPASDKGIEVNSKALSMIYALAATVDAKDHYTYGHSRKVSEYAVTLAESMKLSREKIAIIRAAGLLHDIGKIGIPDSILNKKEPLTNEEWEPIKGHTQLGVAILRHIVDLTNCLPAILHHHEHFDGSGYPAGLKGKNIPIEARILAIADAYEAMVSPRAYRQKLTPVEAVHELRAFAGTQFDPELVEVFCKIQEAALTPR